MSNREQAAGSVRANLCNATITAAISSVVQGSVQGIPGAKSLHMQANFTYGSGGTSADAYVQTSLDGGATWFDIANFHFLLVSAKKLSVVVIDPATPFTAGTTPGSGTLTANTVLTGILGDRVRVLLVTTGTYAGGTTLAVDVVAKG